MQRLGCWVGVLVAACSVGATYTVAAADSFFQREIALNSRETCIVSNLPEETVLPLVWRSEDLKRCRYTPLASVGTYGRKGKDLLDWPWDKDKKQTVIVIDRASLTDVERAALAKLMPVMFPRKTTPTDEHRALIWTQNWSKNVYQVLLDLPRERCLKQACDDLWAIQFTGRENGSRQQPLRKQEEDASVLPLLTNEQSAADALQEALPYREVQLIGVEQWDAFQQMADVNLRFVALNWNGQSEITPAAALPMLLDPQRDECDLDPSKRDRAGLTPWHRLCRKAAATRGEMGGVATWVVTAPTERHLRKLTLEAAGEGARRRGCSLNLCDLSYMRSLAVGAYIASREAQEDRLVPQIRLESIAKESLGAAITVKAMPPNWGKVLQKAFGADARADDPFASSEQARQVSVASKADGLLLLWVESITPEVTYQFPRRRVTPVMGPFEEQAPPEPDPDEKRGLFGRGGRKYPDGVNDGNYRKDHDQWERDYARWEQRKREYARKRETLRVNWEWTVEAIPRVSLTGQLLVVDQRADKAVVWSCPVKREVAWPAVRIRTLSKAAIGDDQEPGDPYELADYQSAYTWDDCIRALKGDRERIYSLGQAAVSDALRETMSSLADVALWRSDLKPWNVVEPVRRDARPTPVGTESRGVEARAPRSGGVRRR